MIGTLINAAAIILGTIVGLLLRKGIPQRLQDTIGQGQGLCVILIGLSSAIKTADVTCVIICMVVGSLIGAWVDIEKRLDSLGKAIERKVSPGGADGSIAKGFVTASLVFCVGAMAIVGSLNAGLTGDYEMLLTKSVLDLISSAMLSVSLGIGVMFAAVFVLVFQGAIVLLAGVLQPLLTAAAINEIVCAGSLLIVGLGLNLMGITKIKVADYLPAIVIAPILCAIIQAVPALSAFFG